MVESWSFRIRLTWVQISAWPLTGYTALGNYSTSLSLFPHLEKEGDKSTYLVKLLRERVWKVFSLSDRYCMLSKLFLLLVIFESLPMWSFLPRDPVYQITANNEEINRMVLTFLTYISDPCTMMSALCSEPIHLSQTRALSVLPYKEFPLRVCGVR